jgi:hypothetical protein
MIRGACCDALGPRMRLLSPGTTLGGIAEMPAAGFWRILLLMCLCVAEGMFTAGRVTEQEPAAVVCGSPWTNGDCGADACG